MHELKLVILSHAQHHVAKAFCSCIAGSAGICSHIVGLLKQLIHYVLMKLNYVPVDLTCTQMQQSWHKPRPTEIEPAPVMSIAYLKAKQSASQAKKNPVVCSLCEARVNSVQDYNFEQLHGLKSGLLDDHSSCAFAQLLLDNPPEEFVSTPFGCTPKGSILSYQALEYEKPQAHGSTEETSQEFPGLPIGILDNAPCVFEIESEEQCTELSKITITLDEAHSLERSTREQLQSTKWQQSRVGRVTASGFGDVLLRQSLPSESFINSFFNNKEYTTMPVQINHDTYVFKTK